MTEPTMPTPAYPVDALVSYHYYSDPAMMRRVESPRLRLIADSGAFSALTLGTGINLRDYAAWCQEHWHRFCWVASLDVIGDPHKSLKNWLLLRDHHNLLTVPTLHAGAGAEWVDVYASEGVDLIGLGGMAGQGQAGRAYRWAVHTFRYARDRWPQVRFHLWGVTAGKFLNTLPAWSADSSGLFTTAFRYGTIRLFDPSTGMTVPVTFQGHRVYQHGRLLRRVYGVDPSMIERAHGGNDVLMSRLIAVSNQRYAAWLQARHQVAPPSMYRDPHRADLVGPRVHIVSTNPAYFQKLINTEGEAWNPTK